MVRKKKSVPPPRPSPEFDPATVLDNMNFDSLEEKIRGEEIMIDAENRSRREAKQVKKKLDEVELNRRMEELRRKISRNDR